MRRRITDWHVYAQLNDTDRAQEYLQKRWRAPAYPEALNNLGICICDEAAGGGERRVFAESIRVAGILNRRI